MQICFVLVGEFVFYEGLFIVNGKFVFYYVFVCLFKDFFFCFKVMQGYYVICKGGWDIYGLLVEISVEKKFGWLGCNYGVSCEEFEEFNCLCCMFVWEIIQDWNEFIECMGYWFDLGDFYIIYQNSYVELVWNLLWCLYEKGLVV